MKVVLGKVIIIPTFNRKDLLKQTLQNLYTQSVRLGYIIIVNDGSTDGTTEMLEHDFPNVIHLMGDGNLWWTGAINKGIQYVLDNLSDVDGVILQNDDVLFDNDWVEKLMLDVDRNPNSLIGCVNVNSNDKETITWAGKNMNTWFATSNYYYRGKNINSIKNVQYINSFDLIGRGIYIPIEVFKKIGLFDYMHFKHCGDTELPLRARMAGFKLIVTFNAIVYDMPDQTAKIDIKAKYTLKDFKYKFFDFRSNAYWKYRFYYGKIFAKSKLQLYFFFINRMFLHLLSFFKRLRIV